ncbi:FtsX-like permease family protein [Iodobacter sp. CM08]|uniref:ABC transporter permease n=1 Tax=Iodobacter sp. CM08 TaxID=3085902 RepID=UPI002980A5EA|nr:FtsX-like permease family protein [Iodobacter sp. CM08]MDW5419028.1 FtsX-like permease family protein [Iodobacter sp. CM08]
MNTLTLALRNLLRNYRRSLATLLAMLVGVVSVLLFGGYSQNIHLGLQTGFVQSSGHLQIQHKDYFLYGNGNPAAYGIADYPALVLALKNDPVLAPMLTMVTPTLSLGGIAGNFAAGVSRTVFGRGVVVEDQNVLRRWNDYEFPVKPKVSALTGTSPDSAVIGTGVARVLALCGVLKVKNCPQAAPIEASTGPDAPADVLALSGSTAAPATGRIEMLAANSHGAPNVAALNVVKAESTGVKELDDMFVALHLSQAQRLVYGAAAPQVTAIVLQLKHTSQMPAAKARLAQLMAGPLKNQQLEVHDFATLNPQYEQITSMLSAIFGFISLLIGSIVLFTVGNTMSMAVVERTVEIGTLRAIGLRQSGIRRLFVCEGTLLGVIGAVIGLISALSIAWIVNHSGLTWTPPGNVDPIPLTVRVWGESQMMLSTGLGLMGVALLSSWWPARRAAKLNIVEALRHA